MEAKIAIEQWGNSLEEVDHLGERLTRFYGRFRSYTQTQTRDTSEYGLGYLSGLLRIETKEAAQLVVMHLVNHTRSRKSRLRHSKGHPDA